jgi:hypothetical protein
MSENPAIYNLPKALNPPPRRSRIRRWARWLLKALLVLFVIGGITFLVARTTIRMQGRSELREVTERLDRKDPGWRVEDIEAARARAAPPDEQDSSLVVDRVQKLIPDNWLLFNHHEKPAKLFSSNHRFPPDELLIGPHDEETPWVVDVIIDLRLRNRLGPDEPLPLGDLVASTEPARTLARSLRKLPHGYCKIEYSDNPIFFDSRGIAFRRRVVALLQDDALLAAHRNDAVTGLQAAHAALNAGRSFGDTSNESTQKIRLSCVKRGIVTAMSVLALTDPKKPIIELEELQTAILKEAEEPILVSTLRGERALLNLTMENLENGKFFKFMEMQAKPESKKYLPSSREIWFYRTFLPWDHAYGLEIMTRWIEVAKQPTHRWFEAIQEVKDTPSKREEILGEMGYGPSFASRHSEGIVLSMIRYRAELVTAAAALACERFRVTRDRWPTSLEEIPKELLAEVPKDPFNGEPIKLVEQEDGIAIVTVGKQKFFQETDRTGPLGGAEYGWRLYNPDQRGLPPLPRPEPKKEVNIFEP